VLLDRLLVAYSHLPHHPGKGAVYQHLLPRVSETWQTPRLRTRFGARFECDLRDKLTREIYYYGFELKDCRVLRRLVRPGQVVIDAGANVGYYSLLIASWLRREGSVHSFEPFPDTASRFTRNLSLNPQLRGVIRLHRMALSDFTGTTGMNVPDGLNQGCNFLGEGGERKVPVITLDEFCDREGVERLDLIKADVEGSEMALLRGAEQTLRRFRPILMIEVNPTTLRRFNYMAQDLIGAIGSYGYRLHYASRWGLRLLTRLPADGEEPNIFAFPIV
jgi:FkbM family methyltransferase